MSAVLVMINSKSVSICKVSQADSTAPQYLQLYYHTAAQQPPVHSRQTDINFEHFKQLQETFFVRVLRLWCIAANC